MMYTEEEFKDMAEWRFRDCISVEEAMIKLFKVLVTGPSIVYYNINEPKLEEIRVETAMAVAEAFEAYSHVLPQHLKGD